jgi:hypothetical protein
MRSRWLAVCALVAGTAPVRPAQAYVRTTTSTGAPMYWNRTVLDITAYVGDPLPGLEDGEILRAARAAAATWSRGQVPCTSIELRIGSVELDDASVGLDGQSRLTFRRQQWCRVPRAEGEPCYDPFALAVTSVFARRTDGEILDADIELNGQYPWGDLVRQPQPGENAQDLQNTLTHELGHYIGLDHTCSLSGERPGQVDDQGHPVPSCTRANEGIRATTMFAAVIPGDVDRRSLSQDDMRAVCEVYPALERVLEGRSSGCALGGRARAGGLGALLALSVVPLLRRAARRRRASRSSTDRSRRW